MFNFPAAYYQVKLKFSSRPYLVLITVAGLYEPTHMPLGAAGAPATQQRMVDRLLAGMEWSCALAYLDDMMVFSRTFDKHMKHLRQLFKQAKKGSLQFIPQKCRLCHLKTRYLGCRVTKKALRPDPGKTNALRDVAVPKDVRSVRSS